MIKFLFKFLKQTFFFIFPPECYSCSIELNYNKTFCTECYSKILKITSTSLQVGLNSNFPVIAVSDYQFPLKSLIQSKKYANVLASRALGQIIYQETVIKDLDYDIIVPIPLHWSRKIIRGYNQTDEIAYAISTYSKKPVVNILKRKKATKFQFSLSKIDRAKNLKSAFIVKSKFDQYKNKKILLVDDLMTTGATLKSASQVLLKKLEPKNIICVVACRVV